MIFGRITSCSGSSALLVGRASACRPSTGYRQSLIVTRKGSLPNICATALQLRREWQDSDQAAAGPAWQADELVFTTRYGTPVEPRNFNRSWDARCTKAGVRKITVHDGRRSCGTLLVR